MAATSSGVIRPQTPSCDMDVTSSRGSNTASMVLRVRSALARHEVGVDPQREPRIGVPQVLRHGPDHSPPSSSALAKTCRRAWVPFSRHPRLPQRGLPDVRVEVAPVDDGPLPRRGHQRGRDPLGVVAPPGQRDLPHRPLRQVRRELVLHRLRQRHVTHPPVLRRPEHLVRTDQLHLPPDVHDPPPDRSTGPAACRPRRCWRTPPRCA